MRVGVVLLREQQRPQVGVEPAEAREPVRARRAAHAASIARQHVAVEVLEPASRSRAGGDGARRRRPRLARPGAARPQRGVRSACAAGYRSCALWPPASTCSSTRRSRRARGRRRHGACSCAAPASRPARGSRRSRCVVDGEEQPRRWRTACRGSTCCARSASRRATAAASGASPGSRPARGARGRARPARPARRAAAGARRELARIPVARAAPSRSPRRAAAWRSAWRPTSRRSSCSGARSSRSARRPTTDWVCVVSDDCSAPERFAAIEAVLGDDPRFVVSRSPRRLGFYRNFERALALAPAGAALRRAGRPGRRLAPGQARDAAAPSSATRGSSTATRAIVARGRRGASPTRTGSRRAQQPRRPALAAGGELGHRRRVAVPARRCSTTRCRSRRPSSPTSTTTGSRSARCALGEIRYVDRPLYDYVQHGDATLGHAAANRMPALRERLGALRRDPRERIRLWRMHYFVDACRLLQFADDAASCAAATAMRARASAARSTRFMRADRSLARARRGSALRGARELRRAAAARRSAPSGCCSHAFAWRRLLGATRARPAAARRCGSTPSRRRRSTRGRARARPASPALRAIAEKIAPLRLAVARRRAAAGQPADPDDRPAALLRRLHRQAQPRPAAGRARRCACGSSPSTRSAPLPRDVARARSSPTAGSTGCSTRVEVAFGRESAGPRGQPRATRSWRRRGGRRTSRTRRCATLGGERFLYLIQEYEPFTFPMGSYAALADESYRLPPRRAVLDRAAARLLPPPRARRATRRRRRRRRVGGVPERDHARSTPPDGRRAGRPAAAPAAVLRAARSRTRRATCSSSACSRSAARSSAARSRRLGAARDRHRARRAAGSTSAAARRSSCCRARRRATTRALLRDARRRAGADVHAASEPRADRDGVRRACSRSRTRSRTRPRRRWRAISPNLIAAEPGDRGDRRRAVRGGRGGRRRRAPRCAAAACAGAATGTSRSPTSCSTGSRLR